jgi:hypothetical protein
MQLVKLFLFGVTIWVVARLAGWGNPLPRWMIDLLQYRKPAGQNAYDSGSDSDSDDDEGDLIEYADGALVSTRTQLESVEPDQKPTLTSRLASWLERLGGSEEVVHEAEEVVTPQQTRDERTEALRTYLLDERERGLSATTIVRAAANEAGAPWGQLSERTVWRAWERVVADARRTQG